MANTKLLLIEDVEYLGRCGDIVSVRPGYARNFLMPRSLAVIADKQALARQVRLQEERQKKAAEDRQEAEKIAGSLVDHILRVEVKVDQDGHMYGSVSATDIVRMLEEQAKVVVEKRAVVLQHPIKTTGEHIIPLKLKEGVASQITLKVLAEGAVEETTPAPSSEA